MGMHHSSALVVGFLLDRDEIDDKFMVESDENDEGYVYSATIDGETVTAESCDEFLQQIFPDARVTCHGDFCTGELIYSIEPSTRRGSETIDYDEPDSYTFAEIASMLPACAEIKNRAAKLGVDLDEPQVISVESYG